ncbi:EthD family reductase [Namhaeicola litoreus]|uniref:EthD family reductase n=1 Tax=Namhaeicola litoreus TaxID=1052145 RepID=A0ABW3XYH8_9FLAO
MKTNLIKVSVFYPNTEGKRFDMDYYLNKHSVLVSKTLGKALIDVSYDKGIGGGAPGASAPFVAIANLYFNSMEDFGASFGPSVPVFMADMPNYTDIEPVVQVSEVAG